MPITAASPSGEQARRPEAEFAMPDGGVARAPVYAAIVVFLAAFWGLVGYVIWSLVA